MPEAAISDAEERFRVGPATDRDLSPDATIPLLGYLAQAETDPNIPPFTHGDHGPLNKIGETTAGIPAEAGR